MAEDTQHQALYRRYRPQTPSDLMGQEHVVRALTGAVREGRLHHAFLFCGPRGTGKTSTARILAKMVNCEHGPTAEPCGECAQCIAIRDGGHVDVVEIDAASHGGVDDARDLREKAPTAPMVGREKIYIIDEAQRLSREAFDALLKLFEEPPPGVRFVLATTEPHKMPPTIVGRCQRFDFRRLTMDGLAELLQKIAGSEGVQLDPVAAFAIARQAEGSARDAVSLLDQASVVAGERIDEEVVRSLLGVPQGEIRVEVADVVAVGDLRGAFEAVDRLVQAGHDLRNVTGDLLAHFRNLLVVQTAPDQEDLLDVPSDAYASLRAQADKFTPGELSRVLELLLAAQTDMRWTTSPRLTLELALVRACAPETDPTPAGVVARLERLERLANVSAGSVAPSADAVAAPPVDVPTPAPAPAPKPKAPSKKTESPKPAADTVAVVEETPVAVPDASADGAQLPVPHAADASSVDVAMLRRSWGSVIQHLGQRKQAVLRALMESATPTAYDGTTLEIAFPPTFKNTVKQVESRQAAFQEVLQELFGISPEISCVVRESRSGDDGTHVEPVEEDDAPGDDAEALRRVQEMLGAQPVTDEKA
ncbi:MAG TPA: DNA polymerase III subunit gamma/tau [Actinomycetota bacterium]|nr:DNA polymerase III subunit gamma/tau [Actinomycetota bacterium]